jgi:hypothetical protein
VEGKNALNCFLLVPAFLIALSDPLPLGYQLEPDGTIKVTVAAILATERDEVVDPKLECLAREMKKLNPKLTGFRLARATCKSLEPGISYRFPLVDGKAAYISLQQAADDENRVSLMVKPPGMNEIVYTSACGKFLPIMTPYETKDKDHLFIAVMIRSCK